MSRYDEERVYGGSRSRAKGSSRGRNGSSLRSEAARGGSGRGSSHSSSSRNSSHKAAQRGGTGKNSARGTSPRSGSGHRRGHKKPGTDFRKLAAGGVLLIAAITLIVFLMKGMGDRPQKQRQRVPRFQRRSCKRRSW